MNRHHYGALLVLLAIAATFTMDGFVARAGHLPICPGYQMTLFQQPSPAWALCLIVLLAVAGLKVGTLIASQREEAGFVAALLGLGAVALRGGCVRSVYQANPHPQVLLELTAEMAIYAALAAALWLAMRWWRGSRFAPASFARQEPLIRAPLGVIALSTLCQTGVCFFLLYVMGQSDAKGQSLAAAAVSGALSVLAIRLVMPLPGAGACWMATLLAAILGYFLNFLSPTGIESAQLAGPLASLARGLPLDHLVAGPSAAIISYWYVQVADAAEDSDADAASLAGA